MFCLLSNTIYGHQIQAGKVQLHSYIKLMVIMVMNDVNSLKLAFDFVCMSSSLSPYPSVYSLVLLNSCSSSETLSLRRVQKRSFT